MKHCVTGKVGHQTIRLARVAARKTAIELNQNGETCESLFAYRCHECKAYHLTRMKEYKGEANQLVHIAAPAELQHWAMPSRAE